MPRSADNPAAATGARGALRSGMISRMAVAGGTDFGAFRALFPVFEHRVWLNTATAAPAARPVLEALRGAEEEWSDGRFDWQAWEAQAHATRATFARLAGAAEADVALMHSLSEAAATVARSLPAGRVVVGAREFRSNLFPWLALEARGFDVAVVGDTDGVVPGERLADAIDEETVLAAVTEVQSSNGFRADLGAIAARCRETGARLFVNGTQSLGAIAWEPAMRPDYLAVHGYKWLLAPRGAAWLAVRPDRLAELEPLAPNWKSVPDPYGEYYGEPLALAPDARKLDTSLPWLPWVGARPALELVAALDAKDVEARCLALARAFREGAAAAGFRLVPEELPSHIVGVTVGDPEGLEERLRAHRVVVAVRGGFVRVGFHAFNDERDVDAALRALGRA